MGMNPIWRGKKKASTILKQVVNVFHSHFLFLFSNLAQICDCIGSGGGALPSHLEGGIAFEDAEKGEKAGGPWDPLVVPPPAFAQLDVSSKSRGRVLASCMKALGKYVFLLEMN